MLYNKYINNKQNYKNLIKNKYNNKNIYIKKIKINSDIKI